MKCSKCGTEVHRLDHHYVPSKNNKEGKRYCLKCSKEEKIVTLI